MLQQAQSARYPKPSARQSRLPQSEEEQQRCPWHAFWTASDGGRVVGLDGVWADDDYAEETDRQRRAKARQQLAAELRDRDRDGAAGGARQRRLENLETHFLFGDGDSGGSEHLRSTFGDAYGRDEAVTEIRNVYDARRFLEADDAAAREAAAAGASVTSRLAASATATVARSDLKRSSWLPTDLGEDTHRHLPSVYKQDFNLTSYGRPYIQPPMRDSGLLPRISEAHRLGSVSRSFYTGGGELGFLSSQKADNDRAARASGALCFIGGPHTHGDNPADFRCGRGRPLNRTDYGLFRADAYQRRPRVTDQSDGVAATFRFGGVGQQPAGSDNCS